METGQDCTPSVIREISTYHVVLHTLKDLIDQIFARALIYYANLIPYNPLNQINHVKILKLHLHYDFELRINQIDYVLNLIQTRL